MNFFQTRHLFFCLIALMISSKAMALDVHVMTHKTNKTLITSEFLDRILRGQTLNWENNRPIILIIDELDGISSDDFIKTTKMTKAQFLQFWRIKFFSGRAMLPQQTKFERIALESLQESVDGIYVVIGRTPDQKLLGDAGVQVTKLTY
jgi:hypothetical protein